MSSKWLKSIKIGEKKGNEISNLIFESIKQNNGVDLEHLREKLSDPTTRSNKYVFQRIVINLLLVLENNAVNLNRDLFDSIMIVQNLLNES